MVVFYCSFFVRQSGLCSFPSSIWQGYWCLFSMIDISTWFWSSSLPTWTAQIAIHRSCATRCITSRLEVWKPELTACLLLWSRLIWTKSICLTIRACGLFKRCLTSGTNRIFIRSSSWLVSAPRHDRQATWEMRVASDQSSLTPKPDKW